GNTIYIDKKLISGLISTHNGVIGDINQMAVLTAKIGHEYKHDGENEVDEEVTKQVQGILSANPSLSKTQLRELLLSQGMDEDDVDKAISNVFEDISCHAFEASIWGGLKDTFGVSNFEEDAKYLAYYSGDKDFFTKYVSSFYMLGQEKDVGNINKSDKEQYEALIKEYKSKAKDGILINLKDKKAIQLLYDARNSYINKIGVDKYDLNLFDKDMQSFYGLTIKERNNDDKTLEVDYEKLIGDGAKWDFTDAEWKEILGKENPTPKEKEEYLKILYGKSFDNVFKLLFNSHELRENFSIIKTKIASKIDTNTNNIYNNSMVWMLELYKPMDKPEDYPDSYSYGNNLPSIVVDYYKANQNGRMSFLEYYMHCEKSDLLKVGDLLKDRKIVVAKGANFTANICLLINVLSMADLIEEDAVKLQKDLNISEIYWNSGYRSQQNNIFNGRKTQNHPGNVAIDFNFGASVNGGEIKTIPKEILVAYEMKMKAFKGIEIPQGNFSHVDNDWSNTRKAVPRYFFPSSKENLQEWLKLLKEKYNIELPKNFVDSNGNINAEYTEDNKKEFFWLLDNFYESIIQTWFNSNFF
ncbi:MAG: hypothetical protein GX435_00775, partial [Exilispira sp.]|nr:hypothetical protein [Exilispira sp.]